MTRELCCVALLLVLAASAGTARAEDKTAADKRASPKVKVLNFPGDTVEGEQIQPDGSMINVASSAQHSSLIRIRMDFIPELIRSAEDL